MPERKKGAKPEIVFVKWEIKMTWASGASEASLNTMEIRSGSNLCIQGKSLIT